MSFEIKKRKYIKQHREIYADMTEKVLESVEGQRAIRAYVQEENDLQKQYKAINADIESWRYIVRFENWFNPLFEVIYGITYILAFSFGIFFYHTTRNVIRWFNYICLLCGYAIWSHYFYFEYI